LESNRLLTVLKQHQSAVAGTVVSGGRIFLEVVAGAVVAVPLAVALFRAIPYLLGRADGADPPGALAPPG
jgi:hypothetical protein